MRRRSELAETIAFSRFLDRPYECDWLIQNSFFRPFLTRFLIRFVKSNVSFKKMWFFNERGKKEEGTTTI